MQSYRVCRDVKLAHVPPASSVLSVIQNKKVYSPNLLPQRPNTIAFLFYSNKHRILNCAVSAFSDIHQDWQERAPGKQPHNAAHSVGLTGALQEAKGKSYHNSDRRQTMKPHFIFIYLYNFIKGEEAWKWIAARDTTLSLCFTDWQLNRLISFSVKVSSVWRQQKVLANTGLFTQTLCLNQNFT